MTLRGFFLLSDHYRGDQRKLDYRAYRIVEAVMVSMGGNKNHPDPGKLFPSLADIPYEPEEEIDPEENFEDVKSILSQYSTPMSK